MVGTQKRSCRLGWILPGPWGWQRSEVSKGQTQGCREEKPKCRAGRSTAWRQDRVGQPNSLWDREKISLRGQIWTLLSVCPSWSFWCRQIPHRGADIFPLAVFRLQLAARRESRGVGQGLLWAPAPLYIPPPQTPRVSEAANLALPLHPGTSRSLARSHPHLRVNTWGGGRGAEPVCAFRVGFTDTIIIFSTVCKG